MKDDGKVIHRQLSTANIGNSVVDSIEDAIIGNDFGTVVLTVQDGHLLQIDIVRKNLLVSAPELATGSQRRDPVLRSRIVKSLEGLKFGQVIFAVKQGKVVQIERTEKTKWPRVEGLHGDGI